MSRKEILKEKLSRLTLPNVTQEAGKPVMLYDTTYIPVLKVLGAVTKGDLKVLGSLIDEELVNRSAAINAQTEKDIKEGRITDIRTAPLYRENGKLYNFPASLLPLLAFNAWINERKDEISDIMKEENAMKNENNEFTVTKEMCKKFKNMGVEQMQTFLNAVYADGMANSKSVEKLINTAPAAAPASKAPDPSSKATDPSSKAPEIDLEKLREEIATIKGIGENRLNEIMSVVGKYTAK